MLRDQSRAADSTLLMPTSRCREPAFFASANPFWNFAGWRRSKGGNVQTTSPRLDVSGCAIPNLSCHHLAPRVRSAVRILSRCRNGKLELAEKGAERRLSRTSRSCIRPIDSRSRRWARDHALPNATKRGRILILSSHEDVTLRHGRFVTRIGRNCHWAQFDQPLLK